jgi:hypothetical protein
VIFADDVGEALDQVMINRVATHVFHVGFGGGCRQIVGRGNLSGRIGGYREFAGAIFRVGRKHVQPLDAVCGHADNAGPCGVEFIFLLRKGVRFEIASLGVSRREEIHDYRPFLERFLQGKIKLFSRQRTASREIGRLIANFERSQAS